MQNKKVTHWDANTEELEIPDIEEESHKVKDISRPPVIMHQVTDITELNRNLSMNLPNEIDGTEIGVLLQSIRPQGDLVEKDVEWNYKSLQSEISQAVKI